MKYNRDVGKNTGAKGRGMQAADREDWCGWTTDYVEQISKDIKNDGQISHIGENTNIERGKARKNPEVLDWKHSYHYELALKNISR